MSVLKGGEGRPRSEKHEGIGLTGRISIQAGGVRNAVITSAVS